jgi:hypothetical protein
VDEHQPDSVVTTPAVDYVAGAEEHLRSFLETQIHERAECQSVRQRDPFGEALVDRCRPKPAPAPKVKISGVHEAELH